jgi:hypothetical protein
LSAKVGRQLKVGSRFRYVFDVGDDWTHACTVESYVDLLEVLGDIPDRPMAYWGWGTIPANMAGDGTPMTAYRSARCQSAGGRPAGLV